MIFKKYQKIPKIISLLFLFFLLYNCTKKDKVHVQKDVMFLKNKEHTANYDTNAVIENPSLLWKFKTTGQIISSPIVNNNTVYVGSEDYHMYAIHAKTGKLKWKFKTAGAISSTAAVSKGKLFFLSYDGYFYCINEDDGKLIWKFKTGGESKFQVKDYYNGSFKPDFWDFYLSSAVVNDNMVYFGSSDSHVYALNVNTGEEIWKFQSGASIHSSPAISDNSLIVGSWDSNVYCLNATTGQEKWTFNSGKDIEYYVMMGIQASPSVDDQVVYIGSRDAKFYALQISSGDTLWTKNDFHGSWMPSSAAVGKDDIYTGSSDAFSFYSIDKKTGDINYSTNTNAYTFSSPAIDSTMAYIGSANGRLYGIDLKKGSIKWVFKSDGLEHDSIQMFDKKGVMNKERMIHLTKGFTEMPQLSSLYDQAFANTGSILSTPAISNQVIYFGSSDGSIYAITNQRDF